MRHREQGTMEQPASVTFVSSYGGLGGSEIYLERLLGNLDRTQVLSVISLGLGPLVERIQGLGHDVNVVPTSGKPWSLVASAWRVRGLLLEARPDVVHANGLKATIVSVLAAAGTALRVVWVRHDFSLEGWRARALARACRRVICVSNALAGTFREEQLRKVHVIHTGMPEVDVERDSARQDVRALIDEPGADPVISLVGQLIPGKGHIELIEIAPQLLKQLPNARVLFVGGLPTDRFAPYVARLEERIEQLALEGAVSFIGHRDDVLTVIAGSDLVVMPSMSSYHGIQTEGFPLLALEALAVGTPVVAYAVGGLPELLADCGSLVTPGDREELRDAILGIVTDPNVWESLCRCGPERVLESFSMNEMVESLQRVYRLAARR